MIGGFLLIPLLIIVKHNGNIRQQYTNWVLRSYPMVWVEYKGRGIEWFSGEVPHLFDWMRNQHRSFPLHQLGTDALDPRSRLIMLYAMCGFANFASLGIMIGGLGTMAPERREEINALGLKSIVSGTLTTCLMGAIVGVLT